MKTTIITGVTAFLVGLVIGWALLSSGTKKTDITWTFGENELKINLDQDLMNAEALLGKVFSEKFSRDGTVAWLKENQGLYFPKDPDIIPRLAELDYDEIVSKELRHLCIERNGPWEYQVDTVQIGIPSQGDQPGKGFANVCENGKYFRQRVKIFTLDHSKYIIVEATGRYECPDQLRHADIQLNADDAVKLLGTSVFSKYEPGMALIVSLD